MSFRSQGGIQNRAHIVRPKILNRTCEPAECRWLGVQLEIDEASLQREEGANCVMAANELYTRQPVEDFKIAVRDRHCAAGAHTTFRESLIEVVAHFSFKHHVREHFVAHASA